MNPSNITDNERSNDISHIAVELVVVSPHTRKHDFFINIIKMNKKNDSTWWKETI